MATKMKVEVWSDVMCPFCYIGKRKFEQALANLPFKEHDTDALEHALENKVFEDAVRQDIYEAQQIGVRGVPFFVYDRKYAISGAQDVSVFSQTIQKAFDEWSDKKENKLDIIDGPSCGPDGC